MARRRSGGQRDGAETKANGGATTGHEAELWAQDVLPLTARWRAQQAEARTLDPAIAASPAVLGFGNE